MFRFTSASVFLPYRERFSLCTCSCTVGKRQVPFSMTTGNEEFMHECFPKHSRMGTARMNKTKKQIYLISTDEDGKIFFLIRWFLTATSGTKPIKVFAGNVYILLHQREK